MSIGETIRRERLRRGLEIDQLSRETKIAGRLLEAIESDDFEKLPGGVFTRNFVRQYARALGLDDDEIVAELQKSVDLPAAAPGGVIPERRPVGKLPDWDTVGDRFHPANSWWSALLLVIVVMLICSGVYSLWQRRRSGPPAQEQAAASPPPVQAPAPAPASPQPPSASPPPAPETPGAVRIQFVAAEPTWVSVRSEGKLLFAGTLQPKETRLVEAAGTTQLRIGNAGGVEISVNGKPVGPLGPRGQIRIVQISGDSVQITAPAQDEP